MRATRGGVTLGRVSIAQVYVGELDRALVGPRRVRRDLVREARDHLEDATEALHRAGHARSDAERLAVADFGDLDEIVPAFQTTLAVAASRRTAWMLFAVLAIQPLLWDGPLGVHDEHPTPDGWFFAALDHAVEWGGGLMIAMSLALLVLSGIGNRWFIAGRRVARLTALTTLGCAVTIGFIALGMVLLSSSGDLVAWSLFLAFILLPFGATATQARRTLALC
jgi:hypothetical protein